VLAWLDRLGAQVHRGTIVSMIPAVKQGKKAKAKTWTVKYKDGDKKGKARPNVQWTANQLGVCHWHTDDELSSDETSHRWQGECFSPSVSEAD
jgi:hypothetical protein